MNKILKEPLLHFLIVGLTLFVVYEFVAGDAESFDSKVIVVDRDSLLTFVQFRSRAFEPQAAAARLDAMSDEELDRMIADYVREEALHREALALGVDQNDYVIKQRMIQSIQFITNGFVTAGVEITDEDVAEYYVQNRDDYYIDPVITFTHVFFNTENRSEEEALTLAADKLTELKRDGVPFTGATQHGDRFPYFVNYVERSPDFVGSHFGRAMAGALFELGESDSEWRGPFVSSYGVHLVMLTRNIAGRYPTLDEVEGSVRQDAERVALDAAQDAAIQAIVDTYEVRRGELGPGAGAQ
jgi:parvulin-like peptidyl-prolyl isomerase